MIKYDKSKICVDIAAQCVPQLHHICDVLDDVISEAQSVFALDAEALTLDVFFIHNTREKIAHFADAIDALRHDSRYLSPEEVEIIQDQGHVSDAMIALSQVVNDNHRCLFSRTLVTKIGAVLQEVTDKQEGLIHQITPGICAGLQQYDNEYPIRKQFKALESDIADIAHKQAALLGESNDNAAAFNWFEGYEAPETLLTLSKAKH